MNTPHILDIYDRLTQAPDDRTRARVIAEAFAQLEERYLNLPELATRTQLSETELRLKKEIEQVRLELTREIEKVRAELTKEIEQVRAELTKEIEQVRAELKVDLERVRAELKVDMARVRADVLQWSFVFWLTQFGAIVMLLWRLWPLAGR